MRFRLSEGTERNDGDEWYEGMKETREGENDHTGQKASVTRVRSSKWWREMQTGQLLRARRLGGEGKTGSRK